MKRTALILLTAVYLLSIAGIGVNRFYCCGKLASVTLTLASTDHTDKGNCCKHESKSFKIRDGHVMAKTTVLAQSTPALLPTPAYGIAVNSPTEQTLHTNYQANAPPGNPTIPIYTLNCTYRI
ncbi:HYC_CC_PP family protein [Mucilaginibacter flavidus]|uniref:HYC_CC_PP family protein n=1 Tax=Mucilaginibacter flavidus TaxID=2949309 RepID=UPI0020934B03|nr:hypothetical protein [Mucilaginibacter flavidus]MCO5950005.1 hypothetical protein [Mucilaginibacter flavidus]